MKRYIVGPAPGANEELTRPNMSSEQWAKVEWFFEAALDREADERSAWLEQACPNEGVRLQVMQMLDAVEKLPGFLERPPDLPAELVLDDLERGRRIGSYRIVRRIGSGGMAVVYVAERADGQYDHQVAIKVLRDSLEADELTRRFDHERQILASLEHPNIARMYDSGLDAADRPYIVMEFIDGKPITEFCDDEQLPLRERLRLFRDVCNAVAFAHRNLVVHRDLKPSNILVTPSGHVKLLDFGIAKLLDVRAAGDGITRTGRRPMTPGYASPEQVRGEAAGTASDVYQLGELMYELVTGTRPFENTETLLELDRAQTVGASSPSARVKALIRLEDARLPEICEGRSATAAVLRRGLVGDVDAMVLQALHPDADKRYPSGDHLAEDVQKHLHGHPVSARRDTWHYRARRLVRRNRLAAAASAVIVMLLAAYMVTIVRHGIVAARLNEAALLERDHAIRESDKATALAAHLAATLENLGPYALQSSGLDPTRFLSQTLDDIDRRFADQPELKSELWDVLGRVYQRYGDYETAQNLLERALEERRRIYGTPHKLMAESLEHLAWLMHVRGDYPGALERYAEALDHLEDPRGSLVEADILLGTATTLMTFGEFDRAEAMMRASVAMRDSLFGRSDPAYAVGLASLGNLVTRRGRLEEAAGILNEALSVRMNAYGRNHSEVAANLLSLGRLHQQTGDAVAAESLYVEALDIRRSLYGPSHPRVAHILADLGWLRMNRGDLDAAERDLLQAAEIRVETLGPDHLNVAHSWKMIGELRFRQGRLAEATDLLLRARGIYESLYGPDHSAVEVTQGVLDQVKEARASS